MKKVVLFGAGQVGAMTARLLGPDYMIVCAADNSPEKWETELAGIPVTSPENSLISAPDTFCLCVLDPEREAQMRRQLEDIGFNGEIITPASLKIFDARTATMRLIAEQINALGVPGDVAELGVYRGDFAVLLNLAFSERRGHLFSASGGCTFLIPLTALTSATLRPSAKTPIPEPKPAISATRPRTALISACFSVKRPCSTRDFSRIRSKAAKICALRSFRSTRISMRQLRLRCPFSGTDCPPEARS